MEKNKTWERKKKEKKTYSEGEEKRTGPLIFLLSVGDKRKIL